MSIVASYLLPHAPVFIDQVGGDQTEQVIKTINAYKDVAKRIVALKPDIIVMVSPHGPIFTDAISIYDFEPYLGNMAAFGEYTLNYKVNKSKAFIEALMQQNQSDGGYFYALSAKQFKQFQHKPELDHGITVPLHFLTKHAELNAVEYVMMSYGDFPYTTLMKHGDIIAKTAETLNKRVVLIASGDMSHALSSKGPYHFHPDGPWFDHLMQEFLNKNDLVSIFCSDEQRIANAAECGLRSFAILVGAYNRRNTHSEVLSYEGPFGVGYLIAEVLPDMPSELDKIRWIDQKNKERISEHAEKAHPYVKYAWAVIKYYLQHGRSAKVDLSDDALLVDGQPIVITVEQKLNLTLRRGTFVSIKKNGVLRGCIGTIEPTTTALYKEIAMNAISACSKDPRFDPVRLDELDDLTLSVDVLSELETISDVTLLVPKKYGVVVQRGRQHGVLLPDLNVIYDVQEQLKVASNKAGFLVDEIEKIDRFTVERFF